MGPARFGRSRKRVYGMMDEVFIGFSPANTLFCFNRPASCKGRMLALTPSLMTEASRLSKTGGHTR